MLRWPPEAGDTVHLTLIVLHAIAGSAAFGSGLASLNPSILSRHRWLPTAVLWPVLAMVVFVIAAIAVRWGELGVGTRLSFGALNVLGVVMLYRARRAQLVSGSADTTAPVLASRSIDDLGFVLISLFDGLVIVTVLDLGAPPWVVVLVAVGAVLIGHRSIEHTKAAQVPGGDRRLTAPPPRPG